MASGSPMFSLIQACLRPSTPKLLLSTPLSEIFLSALQSPLDQSSPLVNLINHCRNTDWERMIYFCSLIVNDSHIRKFQARQSGKALTGYELLKAVFAVAATRLVPQTELQQSISVSLISSVTWDICPIAYTKRQCEDF